MHQLKVVAVGDRGVGKTHLLVTYTTGTYPEYLGVVYSHYDKVTEVTSTESVILDLINTGGGGEDYDRLRPVLCYFDTHVFLLCFDIAYSSSFDNIEVNWIPELNYHCPDVPVILVGMKCDLRGDMELKEQLDKKGLKLKTFDEGVELAEKIKAVVYLECSALSGEGVKEVFDKVLEVAYAYYLKLQKKKKRCCELL